MANENYNKYKLNYDANFIDNFPKEITVDTFCISSSLSDDLNDIHLILIEYNLNSNTIDSIRNKLKSASIAQYAWSDSCLLIINRFETLENIENLTVATVTDTSLINRDCYENLYPIPNFIDDTHSNVNSNLKLDSSFVIYVLEAHPWLYFKSKYNLHPNIQMPKKWENGYSKGVTISDKHQIVVYWSIAW